MLNAALRETSKTAKKLPGRMAGARMLENARFAGQPSPGFSEKRNSPDRRREDFAISG